MRSRLFLSLIGISILLFAFKSSNTTNELTWHSWEEAYALAVKENKILIIEVVTAVCPYCIKMENETYKDSKIIQLVNDNFIACKVNPKLEKETYKLGEQVVNGTQLINALTLNSQNAELGKLVFPTTIFYFPIEKHSFVEPGYQPADVFIYMLYNCVKYKEKLAKKKK